MCRAAGNPWLVHFVALAVETGMRRSELLGLLWANVDLEKHEHAYSEPPVEVTWVHREFRRDC